MKITIEGTPEEIAEALQRLRRPDQRETGSALKDVFRTREPAPRLRWRRRAGLGEDVLKDTKDTKDTARTPPDRGRYVPIWIAPCYPATWDRTEPPLVPYCTYSS